MARAMRLMLIGLAVLPGVRGLCQAANVADNPPAVVNAAQGSTTPQLMMRLADPDPEVRANAAESLGKIGAKAAPAVPMLLQRLKDSNADVRFYAAWALAYIGSDARRVIPALLAAMDDPDADTRMQATMSLTAFPQSARQIVPKLIAGLQGSDKSRYYYCVHCIGSFGKAGRGAIPLLLQALSNPELDIRLRAIVALENIGINSPDVEAALLIALKKDEHLETHYAASALSKIATPNTVVLSALADEFMGNYRSEGITSAIAFANLLSRRPDLPALLSGDAKTRLITQCEAAQKSLRAKFNPYAVPATTIEIACKQVEQTLAVLRK